MQFVSIDANADARAFKRWKCYAPSVGVWKYTAKLFLKEVAYVSVDPVTQQTVETWQWSNSNLRRKAGSCTGVASLYDECPTNVCNAGLDGYSSLAGWAHASPQWIDALVKVTFSNQFGGYSPNRCQDTETAEDNKQYREGGNAGAKVEFGEEGLGYMNLTKVSGSIEVNGAKLTNGFASSVLSVYTPMYPDADSSENYISQRVYHSLSKIIIKNGRIFASGLFTENQLDIQNYTLDGIKYLKVSWDFSGKIVYDQKDNVQEIVIASESDVSNTRKNTPTINFDIDESCKEVEINGQQLSSILNISVTGVPAYKGFSYVIAADQPTNGSVQLLDFNQNVHSSFNVALLANEVHEQFVDVSELPNGVYILRIVTNHGVISKMISVAR